MTCIAGYIDKQNKTIYMGADTVSVCGSRVLNRKDTKLFIRSNPYKNTMLIGFTGSYRMGQLLRYKLIIPQHLYHLDTYEYMCTNFIDAVRDVLKSNGYLKTVNNQEEIGRFLVAYDGRLFKIDSDLQVGESQFNYDACGNAEDVALACIRTLDNYSKEIYSGEEIIRTALKVSEDLFSSVRNPFTILKLEQENDK